MTEDFDPEKVLAELERAGVLYVVIGGLAAAIRGSPLVTGDVDVCPSRDPANLERLSRALRSLGARIRTADTPEGLPFACDAEFFRGVALANLVTRYGEVDVSFQPSGTAGYEDLVANADVLAFSATVRANVASLADVIRSKAAADRPKDRAAMPQLRTLLAELERRSRGG